MVKNKIFYQFDSTDMKYVLMHIIINNDRIIEIFMRHGLILKMIKI